MIFNTLNPFRYDKLIIDDQVYIYNDSEKRIEKLPYSVYSTAATGTIGSSNISHSVSHSNLYSNSTQDSKEDVPVDSDQPTLLRYRNILIFCYAVNEHIIYKKSLELRSQVCCSRSDDLIRRMAPKIHIEIRNHCR